MKSNRFASLLVAGMGAMAAAMPSVQGAQLTVTPDPVTIQVGQSQTVNLMLSDFRPGASAIAGFDFTLLYDPAVILADALVYGVSLNGGNLADSFQGVPLLTPGVAAFEISYLLEGDLVPLQADSFLVASITFHGVGPGTTSFTLDPTAANAAVDADDDPASLPLSLEDNTINVLAKPSGGGVPDAGSTLAMLAGGLILGAPLLRRTSKR